MTEVVTALLLAVHLWCVNVSSTAPLFAMLSRLTGVERASHGEGTPATWLAWHGIKLLFLGATLGLLLAGAMWIGGDRRLFTVLSRFQYKIIWALIELVFYLVCMGLYIWLATKKPGKAGFRRGLLAVLASTNLLYHFPTLFSVMTMVSKQPDIIAGAIGPREFRSLMLQGHVAPFAVHFGLASIAVGAAVTLVYLAKPKSHNGAASIEADEAADGTKSDSSHEGVAAESTALTDAERRLAGWSAGLGLAATGLQIPVGVWLVARLDPLAQSRVLGGNLLAASAFGVSVLLGFRLMNRLGSVLIAPDETVRQARPIQHLLWLIIGLMCITLRAT